MLAKRNLILLSLLLIRSPLALGMESPTGVTAAAGDQSVILHWNRSTNTDLAGYHVYRSVSSSNGPFFLLQTGTLTTPGACDMSSAVINGNTNYYYVTAVNTNAVESAPSTTVAATPRAFANDDEFLDYVQEANFDYFWYLANPVNGLVPDRTASGSACSIAAVGFGLTAICIGADHGWVSRTDAAARVLMTLNTFYDGPQGAGAGGTMGYNGWFYHFLDMKTGWRAYSCELSSIDTCLLLAGVIDVRQYFDGTNATEASIRSIADKIVNRVDWNFFSRGTSGVAMGWKPGTGFSGYGNWTGYNEAMILYILGLGAATNPLPASAWDLWTSGYNWRTFYGRSQVAFGPLFGHEYSHCWIDFRHIADSYMNSHDSTYFENSRRAALTQVAYCGSAPHEGYSSNVWGLTACDGPPPNGYSARGFPDAGGAMDDGTIAPTAAGAAICFVPENSLAALKTFYNRYRASLWTEYGFRDAFNPGLNWWDTDELGIDQGPIVIMIENYRTQRVWKRFMQSPEIQRGLKRAGFSALQSVPVNIQPTHAQGEINLLWNASAGNYYQIEYSPDLSTWKLSPGFVQADSSGTFSWMDIGQTVSASPQDETAERFYRVFQVATSQSLLKSGLLAGQQLGR